MDISQIRKNAAGLGWTKPQARFLADRIRNALAVLTIRDTTDEQRREASTKLLAALEAIEDEAGQATVNQAGIRDLFRQVQAARPA